MWGACTLQLLHLLLTAGDVHVGALALVIDLLQACAMLAEGCLDLQLLFDGGISQLHAHRTYFVMVGDLALSPATNQLYACQWI